jgi:conjugative relaxase-like TrwC/TraI family protein
VEGAGVLTITKLRGAEYLIASVADGLEDYYMGAGEAPGVWQGRWAPELGFKGVVEADALRALVDGQDPVTGDQLLVKHRERTVRAIDVTLSVPKSVSLLWAFGTPETSSVVSIAVADATASAVAFLEERAAVARVQQDGIRRRVATDGFAIATFTQRTSRAGDPQLHTHCLIPNVVRREDGVHVAFDANPLHVWGKATGTVFLNELERVLTERLGVEWGPERNGSRELVGFTREQLRTFSKRTVAIETHLEAAGETVFDSPAERMRADERASLVTRQHKDKTLTPELLRDRWAAEATTVGLPPGVDVDDVVVGRQVATRAAPGQNEVFAALVDPATGLCATNSRFGEAHVVERIAAMAGGRLTVGEVVALSRWFLASNLVVRLAPDVPRRRPAEWSTIEHRAVEDGLLARLHALAAAEADAVEPRAVVRAIAADRARLGPDQAAAVRVLCGDGPAVRTLVAPAGHGKTTALHAAVTAAQQSGRDVVVVAPTHKAVGELRTAGLDAETIARARTRLGDRPLEPGTILVIDEVSQVGTRDAAALLDALADTPGAQLWCVGDVRQAQSVAAGGLAVELERLATHGEIPSAGLTGNRRQQHVAEQQALTLFRAGDVDASQTIRAEHGWELEHPSSTDTRQALAVAAVADADRHGAEHVAVLAVSHADCEDLADRIRALRAARGELRGPTLIGPGWANDTRTYAAGDRILLHTNDLRDRQVANGSTGTVLSVDRHRLTVLVDDGSPVDLPASLVAGYRPTGPRTCRTRGLAPSTAPRAAPGCRSTSSAPRPWTGSPAMSARAVASSPPTPGTPAPNPTTPSASLPIRAPRPRRSSTPCTGPNPRRSPPPTTTGPSTANSEPNATNTPRSSRTDLQTARPTSTPPATRSPGPPTNATGPPEQSQSGSRNATASALSPTCAAVGATTSPAPTRTWPPPTGTSTVPATTSTPRPRA